MTTTEEGMDAIETENISVAKDEQEILELHNAIGKVLEKIKWHEDQIEERKKDIQIHEGQIVDLRESLRKHVAPLMIATSNFEGRTREPSDATRSLIIDCLRKSQKPLDTKQIKSFLEKHGNATNPSVELSRMVKRGNIERSGRGFYQIKK